MTAFPRPSMAAYQADCLRQTEVNLKAAERHLDARRMPKAKRELNIAAAGIRQLRNLYNKRRGQPREDLSFKIRYLATWQVALIGAMETVTMHSPEGTKLLEQARVQAEELATEQPNVAEFSGLIDMIDKWTECA